MRLLWGLAFLPARVCAAVGCAALLVAVSPLLAWSGVERLLEPDAAE